MSKDEYLKAFKDSGLKASSWCYYQGISQFKHRNYQNGRTVVPDAIASSAKQLVELSKKWGVK